MAVLPVRAVRACCTAEGAAGRSAHGGASLPAGAISPPRTPARGSADRVSVRTVPDEQESAVRTPPSAR